MLISVIVTTFNHEKYISKCLEGILFQKGDFLLEIIIGDDGSTDNTRNIIEEYKVKYPNLIFVFPLQPNLGITKNLERCLEKCNGQYIAICEGDDFWIDPHKLKKQMHFLEQIPECSMCFNSVLLQYESRNSSFQHPDQAALNKIILRTEDLIEKNYIGNFSCCMYRTTAVRQISKKIFDMFTVDWMFNMACEQFGRIGYLPEVMSVYRIHEKGAWSGISEIEKLKELLGHIDNYNAFLDFKYSSLFLLKKKLINIEIERLNNLSSFTASVDNNSVNRDLYWFILKVKSKAKTIIRKIIN